MANGQCVTDSGRNIMLNRCFKSSPDYTAPNYFKVGTGVTEPTSSDTDLDTAITIAGGATKAVASGYPLLDETNIKVTNRCILLTTDCNGNNVSEFGLFNSDGTPKIFSRAVFTAISKTSSVQIIFKEVDKIEKGTV